MPAEASPPPPPSDGTDTLSVAPGRVLPAAALRFTFSRASGPGGQNVNKVNTRATLTVGFADLETVLPRHAVERLPCVASHYVAADPDRLVIHAGDARSQRGRCGGPPVRRAARCSAG